MFKYRIKIQENNGGRITYIPQVGEPVTCLGITLFYHWSYLRESHDRSTVYVKRVGFAEPDVVLAREEAIRIIKHHQHIIATRKLSEIKKTVYEPVN
jgi:hypothetical protein